jgi:hypothetical protein
VSILAKIDDTLIDAVQSASISVRRIGMDKFEAGRNLAVLKTAFAMCVAGFSFGYGLGPALSGYLIGSSSQEAFHQHRHIGDADTVRGWQKAASNASWSRTTGRNGRMFAIVRLIAFAVLALMSGTANVESIGMVSPELVPTWSCLVAYGVLAVVARYLRACVPPPPTSLRMEDRIPTMVQDAG